MFIQTLIDVAMKYIYMTYKHIYGECDCIGVHVSHCNAVDMRG